MTLFPYNFWIYLWKSLLWSAYSGIFNIFTFMLDLHKNKYSMIVEWIMSYFLHTTIPQIRWYCVVLLKDLLEKAQTLKTGSWKVIQNTWTHCEELGMSCFIYCNSSLFIGTRLFWGGKNPPVSKIKWAYLVNKIILRNEIPLCYRVIELFVFWVLHKKMMCLKNAIFLFHGIWYPLSKCFKLLHFPLH